MRLVTKVDTTLASARELDQTIAQKQIVDLSAGDTYYRTMINTTNKILITLLAATTVTIAIANKPSQVKLSPIENNNKIELTNIPIAETGTVKCRCCPYPETHVARPKYNLNYCPRAEGTVAAAIEPTVIDDTVPLHCLEKNCGLGVYSKRKGEPDEVERCSFCGASKPVNG
jgi:hypothetical protein